MRKGFQTFAKEVILIGQNMVQNWFAGLNNQAKGKDILSNLVSIFAYKLMTSFE